jgi:beta-galactosidase/beta-glucuronidase
MRARTILSLIVTNIVLLTSHAARAQETQRQYLSGRGTDDAGAWEFFCTAGAKSGNWTTIPVPSCWDALGFGSLNYFKDKEPYEQGKYRLKFTVPAEWRGQQIAIVFDGVLTDTHVSINGKPAGDKHQGGFYRFRYDVTPLLKIGEVNLLEVIVDKHSANESVNRAERQGDYWMFGGIFRPVWLEVNPRKHIDRVASTRRPMARSRGRVHRGRGEGRSRRGAGG